MQDITPDYYSSFHCLAGACPDNCCKMWTVVVDDEAAARYKTLPGSAGARLRDSMTTDEDGDRVLKHRNGNCCLLTEAGLCQAQLDFGEEALCKVCREFPRLCQDFTAFREHSLSLACPEAARLILTAPHLPLLSSQGGAAEPVSDYDSEVMAFLRQVRAQMFSILAAPGFSAGQKLALCLYLGENAQTRLDGDASPAFSSSAALARLQSARSSVPWQEILAFYRSLEILTPEWAGILDHAMAHPLSREALTAGDPMAAYPQEFINLCFSELYRTVLCAVADYDLLPRVQSAILSCAVSRYLICLSGGSTPDRLRLHWLYAKEISHDIDNQDALLDACLEKDFFSTDAIVSMLL